MKIQLIIPIFNPEESFFYNSIPRLQNQTNHTNILLINSGCAVQIGEYEILSIDKKEFNHANTRNLALKYEADYYLFMTQDAIPYDEHLIANLIQVFDDSNVVVAYARQLPKSDADPIETFARETNYPAHSYVKSKDDLPTLGIKTFFCSDSCAMYRASYFKSVGGFTPDLNTNEDMEFAARSIMDGKKIAYCAEAKVFHSHRFSMIEIWKRYRAIGMFFANHKWILDTISLYSKAESTGIKQALAELNYLARKAPLSIFRSCVISAIKFAAFKYSIKTSK
jgi:rhamnosyltransferase